MNSIEIEVCIPTYKRVDKLIEQVENLLVQLGPNDIVKIYDNDLIDEDTVSKLISDSRVIYMRNSVNIGLTSNISTCFENISKPWFWLLSDDDPVKYNAVAIIKETIIDNDEPEFINFSTELMDSRKENLICKGMESSFKQLDSFSNLLLISNNVYKREFILPALSLIRHGCCMSGPQLVPFFLPKKNSNTTVLYSCKSIVHWGGGDKENSWNRCTFFNVFSYLDLVEEEYKEIVFCKISLNMNKESIFKFYLSLLYGVTEYNQKYTSLLLLMKLRVYYENFGSFGDRMILKSAQISIKYMPNISRKILDYLAKRIRSKSMKDYLHQVRKLEMYI